MSLIEAVCEEFQKPQESVAKHVVSLLMNEGDVKDIALDSHDTLHVMYNGKPHDFSCSTAKLRKLGLYIHGFREESNGFRMWIKQDAS